MPNGRPNLPSVASLTCKKIKHVFDKPTLVDHETTWLASESETHGNSVARGTSSTRGTGIAHQYSDLAKRGHERRLHQERGAHRQRERCDDNRLIFVGLSRADAQEYDQAGMWVGGPKSRPARPISAAPDQVRQQARGGEKPTRPAAERRTATPTARASPKRPEQPKASTPSPATALCSITSAAPISAIAIRMGGGSSSPSIERATPSRSERFAP